MNSKDRQEFLTKSLKIPANTCMSCKNDVLWGDFLYNQELCWDCFTKRVMVIIHDYISDPESSEIIFRMLVTMAEIYKKKLIVS